MNQGDSAATTSHRRLAVIMFTDMVGFSALADRDERQALALLDEHNALLRPLFSAHAGSEINTTGDGFHIEFPSALDAVSCAIDVQKALRERNAANGGPPIATRIGIHLGDVEARDNDLHGDAVNVAARIEPLAPPGGICISEQVYAAVRKSATFRFGSIDTVALKNIAGTINVYRVLLPWDEEAAAPTRRGRVLRWRKVWSVGALVVAVVGVGFIVTSGIRSLVAPAPSAAAPRAVAILPFRQLGSAAAGEEYLGVGLADALIAKLSNLHQVTVRSTNAVLKYDVPNQDALAAAREQKVGAVLSGTVQRAKDRIRISVQLVKTEDGVPLWAGMFDENFNGIFEVQDAIAEKVAAALVEQLSSRDRKKLAQRYTDHVEAYDLYLRGRYQWTRFNKESLARAQDYFQQAIAVDPKYALAYAGLSDVYIVQGYLGIARPRDTWKQVREAAEKAVALDDSLAEAHISLAAERLFLSHDWTAARHELERARSLNPEQTEGLQIYAYYLQTQGRVEDAVAPMRRAVLIEPALVLVVADLSSSLYYAGHYGEAALVWNRAMEIDPTTDAAYVIGVQALERQGKYAEALKEAEKGVAVVGRTPFALSTLGYALASAGKRAEAVKIANELEATWKDHYFPPTALALLYAGIGDADRAFAWLDIAYEQRDPQLIWFGVEPQFAPLHKDRRWPELIARLKVVEPK